MSDSYDRAAVDEALSGLEGWSGDTAGLSKTYRFEDFVSAIAFMNRASGPIDEMDHHPEWTNVYDRVEVSLSSHDVGGVTDRDVRLAGLLDDLARG
ncbi:4a-hydroxytetrahydrobiopterin dehydratase [Aeromicrobium sp. CF4.19]|uniref:4a-hydroxytetrahydrobiopterin dehydratase n=1 Tax=Aeromicrobium sp. CF4.19 TaxID=3373082 RepID=UPI003EE77380